MVQFAEPAPWGKSTTTAAVLEALVNEGLLPPNTNQAPSVGIILMPEEREPKPPSGYIVSLV